MVDQRMSRRFFNQVNHSVLITVLSHELHACVHVLMHIDIFTGMYTSLGTGDLLLHMLGRWEKTMVDRRRWRGIFKQLNHSILLTDLSHDLQASGNVLIHIDMFSGMYASLEKGDRRLRMLGS